MAANAKLRNQIFDLKREIEGLSGVIKWYRDQDRVPDESCASTAKTPGAAVAEWYEKRQLGKKASHRPPTPEKQVGLPYPSQQAGNALALFSPPTDTQGRIASKRIKKWSPPA